MKSRFLAILCIFSMASIIASCATPQEGQDVKRGAGYGAAGGALLGLAMGAAAGSTKYAVAGAATGAAAGAAAGGMYMYDQSREDRRTKMLADSIGGARKGETADAAGKRHLGDFAGDWNLDIWALDADGKKITARGKATAVMPGKDTLRIEYKEIESPGYEQKITGSSLVNYSANNGFTFENEFSVYPEVRKFVGEYVPEKNAYNFYPSQNKEGETITGVIRSNIRIELRVSGGNLVVAETYTMMEGKEVKIQSYRFIKQ